MTSISIVARLGAPGHAGTVVRARQARRGDPLDAKAVQRILGARRPMAFLVQEEKARDGEAEGVEGDHARKGLM